LVNDAQNLVLTCGVPGFISFDHDLGTDDEGNLLPTGYDFAKWLVEMDMDDIITIPRNFLFAVHSANPVGAKNIQVYLYNYLTSKEDINMIHERSEANNMNRNFFIKGIRENPFILEDASMELCNDRTFLLECVQSYTFYLFEELNIGVDLDFESSIKMYQIALTSLNEETRREKKVKIENHMYMCSQAISYAPKALKEDREFMLEAIKSNKYTVEYAHYTFLDDRSFILDAMRGSDGFAFRYGSEETRSDPAMALLAVQTYEWALSYASMELRDDRKIVLEAVKFFGMALQFASERLRDDREVVLTALKSDGWALPYVSDALRNDTEIVSLATNNMGAHKYTFM
jgi:hypothetical protein